MKTKIMQQENPKGAGVQQHLERPGFEKTFCGRKYDNGHWHHYHDFDSSEDEVDDHVSCSICRAGAKKFIEKDLVGGAVDKIKRASRVRNKVIKGKTVEEFISFLEETLIPDLKESGTIYTAQDLETAVKWIKHFKGDK